MMRQLLTPPVFANEVQTHAARQLYIIVWTLMLSVTIVEIVQIVLLPQHILRWLISTVAANTAGLVVLGLTRRGHAGWAARLLVGASWVIITALAWTGGGIHALAMPWYFILVLTAGILLGGQAGLITAGVCSLTTLTLVYAEITGTLPPSVVTPQVFDVWVSNTLLLVSVICLQYLTSRSIHEALARAYRELSERKQAEKKYHQLFAEMSSGCALHEIICDNDGNAVDYVTLEINHTYESFLNTKNGNVIGKKASELLPQTELKQWLEIFGPVAIAGKSVRYETYSPFNQKYFEGNAYCPEKGKFAATFSDITERKRAEEALRVSEARFRVLVESTDDIIFTLDREQRHTGVFGQWLEKFNLTPEVFLGKTFRDLFGLENAAVHEAANARALAGESTTYEWSAQQADRIYHYQTSVAPLYDQGEIVGVVGIGRDITESKQTTNALRRERDLVARIMETSPVGIILLDRTGQISLANRWSEQILGLTRAEMIGRAYNAPEWRITDFAGQPVPDEVLPFRQVLDTGRPVYGVQHAIEWPDGRQMLLSLNAAPLVTDTGQLDSVVVTLNDVTGQVQAEATLRQSEARHRLLFNEMLNGFALHEIICDPAGRPADYRFLEVNPAFERLTGLRAADLINRTVRDVLPMVEAQWIERYGQVALTGQPVYFEDYSADLNKYYEVAAFCPQPGQFAVVIADVTRRKLAEKARTRLAAAIDQAAESVIITDLGGTILYVNPAFERVTGYSQAEALGQNPRMLKSGKHDTPLYEKLWTTISAGQVWQGRLVNKKKDGSLFTEEATISPVRDEQGVMVNYVAVKRDVTHELELEQQYLQAQKLEAVGQLTAGIAHDFNNLLTGINGFTSLVQAQLSPDSPFQELLEIVLSSGQRAAILIRQLLTFSRKQIIQPQVLDLNIVVTELEKMLRRVIGEDIELVTRLASGLWPVKADSSQLDQVILNLTINARDAMPSGGRLTIETANISLNEGYGETQPGDYVLLAVSDTGVGMSEAVQAHIFEPFFTTKAAGKGSGLGLATVYGIVKQSGGTIYVYSEAGLGTTFKIYLPRIRPAAAGLAPVPVRQKMPTGSETILLVEDHDGVRTFSRHLLQGQGYRVLEARNGEEAFQLADDFPDPIHLLLTDVVMPGLNGRALAEQLTRTCPGLKTLFMSGYESETIAPHGVLDPGIAFLPKPFGPAELAHKVRVVLDG